MISLPNESNAHVPQEGNQPATDQPVPPVKADSREIIYRFGSDGIITFVNSAFCDFFGRSREESVGRKWHLIALTEEVPMIESHLHSLSAENPAVVFESRVYSGTGEIRRMEFVSYAWFNPEGFPTKTQCAGRDISERKQMEVIQSFLAQSSGTMPAEPFFNSLARFLAQSLAMDFVCIDRLEGDGLNARTLAVWCDGRFEDNVAYALKDTPCGVLVGKRVCCYPAKVSQFFPNDPVLQDLRAESYVGVTLFNHAGQPIGLIATIRRSPITNRALAEAALQLVAVRAAGELERVQAETAMRESEQQYRSLFEHMSEGLAYCRMLFDEQGQPQDWLYLVVNPQFETLTGLKAVAGKRVSEVIPDIRQTDYKLFEIYCRVARNEVAENCEIFVKALQMWFSISVFCPKRDHFVAMFEVITARKQAEAALQNSEANFRKIIEASPVAMAINDQHQNITFLNRQFITTFGYTLDEIPTVAAWWPRAYPDPAYREQVVQEWQLAIAHADRTGTPVNLPDYKVTGKDGTVRIIRFSLAPLGAAHVVVLYDLTELKKVEAANAQLAAIVEFSDDAIIGKNLEGITTSWNAGAEQLFGYSAAEVVGTPVLRLIPADRKPEMLHILDQIRKGEKVRRFESTRQTKDGRLLDVSITVSPIKSAMGKIIGASKVVRDITERKRAEAKLAHNQALLNATGRMAKVGGWEFDLATQSLLWTDEVYRIHEVGEDFQPTVATAIDFYTPESKPVIIEALRKAVEEGESFDLELQINTARGRRLWVHAMGNVVTQDGQIVGVCGSFQDINEQKASEALLRLQSAALEAVANAIVITDITGRIEWVNHAFTTFTGYSAAEAIGQNPRLLKSGQHDLAFYQEMWRTILAGKPWHGEFVNRRKDGTLYDDEMTITPLRNEREEITRFIAVKQDVTARKQLEAQFRQAQKMEAFGQLAGGVAHDFNNILAAIILEIDMQLSGTLPDEVRKSFGQINASANRAAVLIRKLLQFSRKQRMQPCLLDLNDVIISLAQMLQRLIGEHITLHTHLPAGKALVKADVSMLEQVLMNLAVNARDAMPSGGKLDLRLQVFVVDDALVARHQAKPGSFFRLSVADNGTGILPEVLPRIFEPFFTTKDVGKGTGLGLSAVQGIMASHQGWVEVESTVGQGTTFHLYLPQAKSEPGPEAPAAEAKPRYGGTETILLVEDDLTLQNALSSTLKHFGYQIITAESGKAALELWPRHRDAVALLLTDIVMPHGLSGTQLAAQLQKDKPGLKTVFMSGYPREALDQDQELLEGANFLQKPFKPSELVHLLRQLLDAMPK